MILFWFFPRADNILCKIYKLGKVEGGWTWLSTDPLISYRLLTEIRGLGN